MQYKIKQIVSLHRQGKRNYNEDFLFPEEAALTINDRLFMVCDGVGGSIKGDQASRLVCSHFPNYVLQHHNIGETKDFLTRALRFTEGKMSEFIQQYPETKGMATTLTYLHLTSEGAVIAWAGDSRIYHIRDNQIIHRTTDHSLVNKLLAHGEITEEEAKTHPKRNVILRAVMGSHQPTKIDVILLADIQPGDYFLLCTDGILEAISDEYLLELLRAENDLGRVQERIDAQCQLDSNDNYSMILFQVEEAFQKKIPAEPRYLKTREKSLTSLDLDPQKTKRPSILRWMLIGLIALILSWLIFRPTPRKAGITYIGEGGILIEHEEANILIDAFSFPNIPGEEENKIEKNHNRLFNSRRPFDDIGLILSTYYPQDGNFRSLLKEYLDGHQDIPFKTIDNVHTAVADRPDPTQVLNRKFLQLGKFPVQLFEIPNYTYNLMPPSDSSFLQQTSIDQFAVYLKLDSLKILYAGVPNLNPLFFEEYKTQIKAKSLNWLILNEKVVADRVYLEKLTELLDQDLHLLLLPNPSIKKENRDILIKEVKTLFPNIHSIQKTQERLIFRKED